MGETGMGMRVEQPLVELDSNLESLSREELLAMAKRTVSAEVRAKNAEAKTTELKIQNRILRKKIKQKNADLRKVTVLADYMLDSKDKDETFHILNRDGFLNKVENIRDLLDRRGGKVEHQGAVMLIDIDNFKNYNSQFGHKGGDDAIMALVEELKRITRHTDIIGRYAGDEFTVFFPGATAEVISEKLKKPGDEYAKINVTFSPKDEMGNYLPPVTVTVSGGIADISRGEDLKEAIKGADRLAFAAKETGRNRLYSMGSEMPTERKTSL